jgi:hypothetical protein
VLGPASLAAGGQLGGSQAGARLLYNFSRQVAASLRTSTDVGRKGVEFAAGVRVQPLISVPVWVTAERRQRLGRFSNGRNAFAIFAETGLYQRPMPWEFSLDAYLQTGVVGLKSRDWLSMERRRSQGRSTRTFPPGWASGAARSRACTASMPARASR